jgi:hypothetical protein
MKTGNGPKSVGAFLASETLKRITVRLDDMSNLLTRWKTHVGEPMASRSYPVSYVDGRLSVRADTPAWASRLRQSQQDILNNLRRDPYFTSLRELQIRVLPGRGDVLKPERRKDALIPSRIPEHAAQLIQSVAGDIANPALRSALSRLASAPARPSHAKK